MASFLFFTSLQTAWESSSIPEIVALPFLSWWLPRWVPFPLHIRTHSVFWASIQKAPDKIIGGDILALLEGGHAGSSAAGQLSLGWDGSMGISLVDSDHQLSHRAAQFPWNLDLVGLNLAPRVLSPPELMSQNVICWGIDCVRSRWKASLCFFQAFCFPTTDAIQEHMAKVVWCQKWGARTQRDAMGVKLTPPCDEPPSYWGCRWPSQLSEKVAVLGAPLVNLLQDVLAYCFPSWSHHDSSEISLC